MSDERRYRPRPAWRFLATPLALLMIGSLLGMLQATPAQAAVPKALINADTVTGGASSDEATFATSLGFSVTVVPGGTWDAMTQAQFAQYQVLIAGDPSGGTIPASLVSNVAIWAPVVMGTAVNTKPGNRVLVGTDPVNHFATFGARTEVVISDGIDYAGALAGRTGLYMSAKTGGTSPDIAAFMGQLSSGSGSWTQRNNPLCGGTVAKIASTSKFNSLTTADLAGWNCSVHESFPTFASDWIPLAIATDPSLSRPTCGTDTTTSPAVNGCGEAYVLVSGAGIVAVSPDISMSPVTATNAAGRSTTVTATVTHTGSPVAGQFVTFTVTGQNSGVTGTCVPATGRTDVNGHVAFTYAATNGPGDDTILAAFTDGSGSTEQASAAVHWAPAGPALVTVSPGSGTGVVGVTHTVTALVVDAGSNPVTSTAVAFTVAGPGATNGVATTDGAGRATFTFTSLVLGTSTITAASGGINSAPATKVWSTGPPANVTLTPGSAAGAIGVTHTITAFVVDVGGNPVTGTAVAFTVTGPGATTGSATTDNTGHATFSFTSLALGTSTITGTAGGITSAPATKTWSTGPPAHVTLSPGSASGAIGVIHTVTATVVDAGLNPVTNTAVAFTVTGPGATTGSGTTNNAGQATFGFTSLALGTSTITAASVGITSAPATKVWSTGAPAHVTLSPGSGSSAVGLTHPVTGFVVDAGGNPVTSTAVAFTVTGPGATTGSGTTDNTGHATFGFTSLALGTSTVTATAGTITSAPATEQWLTGPVSRVTVTPGSASGPIGTSHLLTATVVDAGGNPVTSTAVAFTITGPGATTGSGTTNNAGQVTFSFTSLVLGTSTITATAGGITSGPATKIWSTGAPTHVTLTPGSASSPVGVIHTITGFVVDAGGNPVTGTAVAFTVTGPGATTGSGTTDSTGHATFSFTSLALGTSTITATAGTITSAPATKQWLTGPAAGVVVSPGSASGPIGTSHLLTAMVVDAGGNPVTSAAVAFTVTGPGATTGSGTTSNSGQATFSFTTLSAGTSTIAASSGGILSAPATKIWLPGAPATVALSPGSSTGPVGETHTLTVLVLDVGSNPVPGTAVTFVVTGSGATTGSGTTNNAGQATFSFTSLALGTSTISAMAGVATSTPATRIWLTGPPASVTLSPGSAAGVIGLDHTLTVLVLDAGSNPVVGASVDFSITGPGATTGTGTTDNSGHALFTFTSMAVGTSQIIATSGGVSSAPATKTWLSGPPVSITLDPAAVTGDIGVVQTLTAIVVDAGGNPVAGVVVDFNVNGVDGTTGSGTTDATGRATFTFTSKTAGTSTVGAQAGAVASNAVQAVWTAPSVTRPTLKGYWLFGRDGGVFTFGNAVFFGSTGSVRLNRPVVAMTSTPSGQGYWLFASDGGVFAFGEARFFGSMASHPLNSPIVAMTATHSGQGYWLFASDGGVFAFGDAGFFGSAGATHLGAPIVGIAASSSGQGYWLVGADGAVFGFGAATSLGNLVGHHLASPIVGIAVSPTGQGYWLGASDGAVFAFGDAAPLGSLAGTHLNSALVGIAGTPDGKGYWLDAADGGVFGFGDAPFLGSMAGLPLNKPMNGLASNG